MTEQKLTISLFQGESPFLGLRKDVGAIDPDLAEQLAIDWGQAENAKPETTRPYIRYVVRVSGAGMTLPTILRAGGVPQ